MLRTEVGELGVLLKEIGPFAKGELGSGTLSTQVESGAMPKLEPEVKHVYFRVHYPGSGICSGQRVTPRLIIQKLLDLDRKIHEARKLLTEVIGLEDDNQEEENNNG